MTKTPEPYSAERERLMEASERHKREIKEEIGSLTDNTKQLLTNALLVGGALALAYFAFSRAGGAKRKKQKAKYEEEKEERVDGGTSSLFSQVGDAVIAQATLFLLDLAKEKLSDYLQQRKARHENI